MNKIVILHNIYDKISRDFVDTYNNDYQVIDWYGNTTIELREDYHRQCLPGICSFPAVVDTEQKIIINAPKTIQEALDYFNNYDAIVLQNKRNSKLYALRDIRNNKLLEIDIMINELMLGKRTDTLAISAYRDSLMTITNDYKDETGKATAAVDSLDLNTFVWPIKP